MKLNEIAKIASAGAIKFEDVAVEKYNQEAVLLTGGNILELGYLSLIKEGPSSNLKCVFVEKSLFQAKRLEAGDIVFMSRGASLRAAIVNEGDAELGLLPSPNFLVIKADSKIIQPELIVAYLNSAIGQFELEKITVGAALKNVPVGKLKELEIVVPDASEQTQVKKLFYKNIEALQAINTLYERQAKTFESVINNLMRG